MEDGKGEMKMLVQEKYAWKWKNGEGVMKMLVEGNTVPGDERTGER